MNDFDAKVPDSRHQDVLRLYDVETEDAEEGPILEIMVDDGDECIVQRHDRGGVHRLILELQRWERKTTPH